MIRSRSGQAWLAATGVIPGKGSTSPPMGGIIKTRIGALGAAALLGAIAVPAAGQLSASAAPANLFVNNGANAHCSDSGTGLEEQPFCTVSAAAAVVTPGQIVHIAFGTYPEQVNITRSGTAQAPITFETELAGWQHFPDAGATIGNSAANGTAYALNITGAQHIRISNLNLAAVSEGVHVENSGDVVLDNATVAGAAKAAVQVTGKSDRVTVGRFSLWSGQGIVVDGGATNTVVTTNLLNTGASDAVTVTDAPGTVVVSNSIYDECRYGIVLTGASSGATIENNIVAVNSNPGAQPNACWSDTRRPHVKVDATSAVGTKSDYNVVSTVNGETPYDWAGKTYTDLKAFTTATGQGTHDSFGDPNFDWQGDRHAKPLPTIDSADENAPGQLPVDIYGMSAKDDPITPNTGTGSGYRDRGAVELQDVGSVFTPVVPSRILDTRSGIGVPGTNPLQSFLDLKVAGAGGVPLTGVTAVTLNVTVTGSTGPGYLSLYPTGTGSSSSNLNWTAGETIANLVTVPVSADGKVTFWQQGSGRGVHVIADVAGYYSASGGIFHSSSPVPVRALDTRYGIGARAGAVSTGDTVNLQVTGTDGVPASGVTAVTLNVTATAPTGGGYLTVYPHGKDRPTASNLNWSPGRTIANLVTVPVVDGKVSFFAGGAPGSVQVIADVAGYYNGTGHEAYRTVNPDRLVDTRGNGPRNMCGTAPRPAGTIPAHGTLDLTTCEPNATGLTLNVTVTQPGSAGFLTVYPYGQDRPTASNLNWSAGETIPNAVMVQVGKDGKVSFYNGGSAPIHLVVDLFGYQGV